MGTSRTQIIHKGARGTPWSPRRVAAAVAIAATTALATLPVLSSAASAMTTAPPTCTDSWTNPAGGSWSTASNWSAGVPSGSDVACVSIAVSAPVTGSNVSVGGLVVGKAAGATGTTAVTLNGTTSDAGPSVVLATGTLTAQNTFDQTAGNLLVQGTLATNGNLTLQGAGTETIDATGLLAMGAGQLQLPGPGTFTNDGVVIVPSGASLYLDPSPSTMAFDNASGVLLNEGGDVQVQADATFDEGGGRVVGTDSTVASPAVRVIGGTLDVTGAGASSFQLSSGTLEGAIAAGQTVEAVGTDSTSGTVTSHGMILWPSGGTLHVDPAGSFMNDGLFATSTGQLNLTGSVDNATGATISLRSQLVLDGPYDLTNDGTISIAPSGDVLATFTSGDAASIDNAAGTIADGVPAIGGFAVDNGATFTEGSGTTTGGEVEVLGTLDLSGSGSSSFVAANGRIEGNVAAGQTVTVQGTEQASASFTNDGTFLMRASTLDLPSGATFTNDAAAGLFAGQSNLNGSTTNAATGTFTINDGSELDDSTTGSAFTNAGELYVLNQDSIVLATGVPFVSTGDVRFGVIGGSWGTFGLHADVEIAGSAPQSVELGGSLEPVFPQGNPPSQVTLPPQWTSGDGSGISYAVAQIPSTSTAPFNTVTCGATTPSAVSLACTKDGGLSAVSLSDDAPGIVPTNVSIGSSAPPVSGPCGSPACPTSSYGQSVTLTATVAPEYGSVAPTGTVTFFDGAVEIGTASVSTSDGVTTATLTRSTYEPGLHEFAAVYSGDAGDFAGNSNQLEAAVQTQTPTVSLSAPGSSSLGAALQLDATVSPASSAPAAPTGVVAFFEGSGLLGIAPVSTTGGISSATLTTAALAVGSADQVTAQYLGDVHFAAATSAAESVDVLGAAALRVLVTGTGAGSVHTTGLICPPGCVGIEALGASIALSETPASGSAFEGWSGAGCSGTGTCVVAMSGTVVVVADFAPASPPPPPPPPPAKPTAAQIRARLASEIAPKGPTAKIGSLLKSKRYAYVAFAVLEAGTANVSWYRTTKGKTTVIATGSLARSSAGSGSLTVKLTTAGVRLLTGKKGIAVTVEGSFRPKGSAVVATKRAVTLRR